MEGRSGGGGIGEGDGGACGRGMVEMEVGGGKGERSLW